MRPTLPRTIRSDSLRTGTAILAALFILTGCSASRDEHAKAAPERFDVGETVYACGCPIMCCNTISRFPGGRCTCNVPLKKGSVTRIQGNVVYVKVADREKPVFIKSR